MPDRLLLPDHMLTHHLPDDLRFLLRQQNETWELLQRNYENLSDVETKSLAVGNSTVFVQHNAARLTSTAAQVDETSIRSRPCFLCPGNLPPAQRGIAYGEQFIILCNPFPIFDEHFTIAHRQHIAQRFETVMHTFFQLSRDLGEDFVVLYNGPRCGASAPDHLHLQVGNTGLLPLEDEYEQMIMQAGEKVTDRHGLVAFGVDAGARRFLAIESDDITDVEEASLAALGALGDLHPTVDEPMVNILCWFLEGEWRVIIFPRAKHRPPCFDAAEERRLLISPAAVDLAGVLIAPRTEDYHAIEAHHVAAIFGEVLIAAESFASFKNRFTARFYASRR